MSVIKSGNRLAQVDLRDAQADPPAERFGQVVVAVDQGRPVEDLAGLFEVRVGFSHELDP